MKRIILILVSIILYESVDAQNIYFNKRIDITGDWDLCTSILTQGNGYLVVGDCGPSRHIFLSKVDSIGNLKWTQHYGASGYTYYMGLSGALIQTNDNLYVFCGGRVPPGPRGYSILMKLDSLGNKKWEREYQLLDWDNVSNSISLTKDSGYILTGKTVFTGWPGYRYLLIKTDSLGNQQWYQTYTDNHPNRSYAGKSVIQTPDSGYCIGGGGGYWNASNYYSIAEIIKTDSLGNEKWKKTYGNPLYCNLDAMVCLSEDSCIVASYILGNAGNPYNNSQAYMTKIELDGNEIWNKKIGKDAPNNWVSWIHSLEDGSFLVSGEHRVKDTINKVVGWLFKLNKNGDSLWYREYAVIQGPLDANQLWHFTPTPDGGFAAAGSLFPNSAGGTQDIWVFKTDSVGCLVHNCDGTGITQFNPNAGAQMLVYPNPFSNAFAINYNIPKENKKGVFELRDIMGVLVYSTPLTINVNQLQVVASALKPGLYFASLVVDGAIIKTEKIIKE